MTMQAPSSADVAPAWRPALYAALAVLGTLAIFLPKLALFTLVGSFLAYLALPPSRPRAWLVLTVIAALGSTIGFVRFVLREAIPGILQGGTAATEASAVSRLREIVFAQDTLRRRAAIDPDGDSIGSAALVGELLGRVGLRGGLPLYPPALERYPEPVETRLGEAIPVAGYFFIVCLPTPAGGWTARPGDAIDEEAAERRFLAYAWPAAENT
ncbi:MAG TPA: hypothetical protein VER33_05405, partial [Polyangiaceae bacterium]|nr:hypothetical protein [Polyangiaceae bacterium]